MNGQRELEELRASGGAGVIAPRGYETFLVKYYINTIYFTSFFKGARREVDRVRRNGSVGETRRRQVSTSTAGPRAPRDLTVPWGAQNREHFDNQIEYF
jgi:hypothetical protein